MKSIASQACRKVPGLSPLRVKKGEVEEKDEEERVVDKRKVKEKEQYGGDIKKRDSRQINYLKQRNYFHGYEEKINREEKARRL